jgi:hypothetical protein
LYETTKKSQPMIGWLEKLWFFSEGRQSLRDFSVLWWPNFR